MAQAFIAIGTALSGGGAAAATAGTAASAGFAGGAAAGGVTGALGGVASTLSTVLSIGSALSAIGSGFAQANAKKDQAAQIAVQNAQSRAADAQKRASMAEEFADLVSDQQAVQLANGLNPGVGTPASVRKATTQFAERNLATSRENTRTRSQVARLQRRSLFRGANTAILGGFTQAAGIGADALQAVG